jgi:hypothetical protein
MKNSGDTFPNFVTVSSIRVRHASKPITDIYISPFAVTNVYSFCFKSQMCIRLPSVTIFVILSSQSQMFILLPLHSQIFIFFASNRRCLYLPFAATNVFISPLKVTNVIFMTLHSHIYTFRFNSQMLILLSSLSYMYIRLCSLVSYSILILDDNR